jgi:hypothetical protein
VSLRARLTLFFVAIVVLPVAVVTAYGWSAVTRASERQVRSELELSRRSATLVLAAQLAQAADAVRSIARDPALQRALAARDRGRLQAVLDRERATDLLLAVTAPDGRVLARAGRTEPSFLPGVATPGARELLALRPTGQGWAMLQRRSVTVGRRGCPGGRERARSAPSPPASGWTTPSCSGSPWGPQRPT